MVTSNESSSEFIPLADAAKELGVTHNYLRLLIFKKKLRAVKLGRNWVTTRIWLDECFNGIKRNNTAINDNVTPSKEVRIYDLSFSTKLILVLLSVSFLSSAYQIFPIETVKRIAREIQFPVEASPRPVGVRPQEIIRPVARRAISPAAKDLSEYFSSLRSHTQSLFHNTRSQIAISQNTSSPPFENLSSTVLAKAGIGEGRLGATPPFRKGRLGGISVFALSSLPKLSLPSLSFSLAPLRSFFTPLEIGRLKTTVKSLMGFSELFRPSPPPPSEIAISQNPSSPPFENLSSTAIEEGRLGATPPFEKGRLGGISLPKEVRPLASEVRLPEEVGLQRVNEITRIVERRQTLIPVDLAAVKSSLLSDLQSLNQSLKNEMTQDLSSLRSLYSRLSSENQSQTRVITLTQKIDTLGEATLSNITFSGTGNQFNLKDADIPDDISLTGSISPTSLTAQTLSVSGTGTSTYSGGISATTINLTSTTATSTFSNGIQLGGGCFKTSGGTCLTPASPGGANTAIQFNSNSAFAGDENNLIWDNTLKRLGLGTTTPASLLSVHGNSLISGTSTVGSLIATSTLFVGSNGNLFNVLQNGLVGIGTTTPGSLLSVHGGNTQITGTTTASAIIATSTLFVGSTGQLFNVLQSGFTGIGTTSPSSLLSVHGNSLVSGTTTQGSLIATSTLYVGSSGQRLIINESGNIGIGTTSPSSLLSIQSIANFVQAATSTLYTTLSLPSIYSTSTTATSTFAGSLYVASSTPTQNALLAVGTSSPLLYIDRNTGRLGVGTSSPGLAFSVSGDILGSGILNLTGTGTSTISGGVNIGTLNITSTTATSTFGNGIQLSTGGVRFPDGRTQTSAPVFVRKTADETVNNSTTLQDDDALFLAMAANETWYFMVSFAYLGNSTADIKVTFTVPTGATLRWGCPVRRFSGGAATTCDSITTSGTAEDFDGGGAGDTHIVLTGTVVNSSTAGNLQLQWAQNTATAVDTKVLTNSYLEAHK